MPLENNNSTEEQKMSEPKLHTSLQSILDEEAALFTKMRNACLSFAPEWRKIPHLAWEAAQTDELYTMRYQPTCTYGL